jgi:hypothetical protein
VAQGLGYALMEEYIPGRTDNLHDYLIPTIGDLPPIEVILVEDPEPTGPYGAKGIGEHSLIPTAPAILGAIEHARDARPGARGHQGETPWLKTREARANRTTSLSATPAPCCAASARDAPAPATATPTRTGG